MGAPRRQARAYLRRHRARHAALGLTPISEAASEKPRRGRPPLFPYWHNPLNFTQKTLRGRNNEQHALWALASVAAGLKAVEKMGGALLEAELHRLKGEAMLAAAGTVSEAEAAIEQGIAIARRQNAKSWELRGAMSLARLRRQQGRPQEAAALLASILGWFTEGFDTADLKGAKALLDKLIEPAIAAEG